MLRFSIVVVLQALSVLVQSDSRYWARGDEGVNMGNTRSSFGTPHFEQRCLYCIKEMHQEQGNQMNICKCLPCWIDPKKDFFKGKPVTYLFKKNCGHLRPQKQNRRKCWHGDCFTGDYKKIRFEQGESLRNARKGLSRMTERPYSSSFGTSPLGRCEHCLRKLHKERGDKMNVCECKTCWINREKNFFRGTSLDQMFKNCKKSSKHGKQNQRNCWYRDCITNEFEILRAGRDESHRYVRKGSNGRSNRALTSKKTKVLDVASTVSPALKGALANLYRNRYQRPSFRFADSSIPNDYRTFRVVDDTSINARPKNDEMVEPTMSPSTQQNRIAPREEHGYTPEPILDFITIGSLTFEDYNPKPDWNDEIAAAFEDQMDDGEEVTEDSIEPEQGDSDDAVQDDHDTSQETTQQPDVEDSENEKADYDEEMIDRPKNLDGQLVTTLATNDVDVDMSSTPNPERVVLYSKVISTLCQKKSSRFRRNSEKIPTKKKGTTEIAVNESTEGITATLQEKKVREASLAKKSVTFSSNTTEATSAMAETSETVSLFQLNTSSTENSRRVTEPDVELTTIPESLNTKPTYNTETSENMSKEEETTTESVSRSTKSRKNLKIVRKSITWMLRMNKSTESVDSAESTTLPSISTRSDRFLRQTNRNDLKTGTNDTRRATKTGDNSKQRGTFDMRKRGSPRYIITLEKDRKTQTKGSGPNNAILNLKVNLYKDFGSGGVQKYMSKNTSSGLLTNKDGDDQNHLSKIIQSFWNSDNGKQKKEPKKNEFPNENFSKQYDDYEEH